MDAGSNGHVRRGREGEGSMTPALGENFIRCPHCVGTKASGKLPCIDCNGEQVRCMWCKEPPSRCECLAEPPKVRRL